MSPTRATAASASEQGAPGSAGTVDATSAYGDAATEPVAVFAALGDATRWAILRRVGREAASASALAGELPVSRQAIVKHLQVLERVGLVEAVRHGREVRYTAFGSRLSETARMLESVGRGWDQRLAGIRAHAEGGEG